jgi:hypothetical protein
MKFRRRIILPIPIPASAEPPALFITTVALDIVEVFCWNCSTSERTMSPSNVTQALPELSNFETEMSAAFADDASTSMQASPTQAARMPAGENTSALVRKIRVLAPTLARARDLL